jgi:hypothetical protein
MFDKKAAPKRPLKRHEAARKQPPDLYQVVIECRDEDQQRELFERLRGEGVKVRLLVL